MYKKSDFNPLGALFVLKCQHGYIERDKAEALELQRKKLEIDKASVENEFDIQIGFDLDEED
jgi:hypothetical protein